MVIIGFILIGFLIGTILGSFANAIADRSLKNKSFQGRSYCPSCKTTLRWYDLFPVLSYLSLKGKCRYCGKKISKQYWIVEVIVGLISALIFYYAVDKFVPYLDFQVTDLNYFYSLFLLKSDLLFKLFALTVFTVVFITDLKKFLIPDRVILPASIIVIVWQLIVVVLKVGFLYYFLSLTKLGQLLLPPQSDYFYRHAFYTVQPLLGAVGSGLAIGGFFLLLIIITKGKGMGGGDVKLGAFIGFVLGFPSAILAIVLSFLTGAIFSVALILLGKKHFGQVIPFGPFLVIGSLIAMLWGNEIIDWYINLSI